MEKRHIAELKIYVKLELISCGNTRNLHAPCMPTVFEKKCFGR